MNEMEIKKDSFVYSCKLCNENKAERFYKTFSPYCSQNGKLIICKKCLKERYDELVKTYMGDEKQALRHLCYNFDLYFSEDIYMSCKKSTNNTELLQEYFRQINSMKSYRDLTSMDSRIDGVEIMHDIKITKELIKFWGRGLKTEEYSDLQNRYDELLKDFPSDKAEERYIIKSICKIEKDIEDCRKVGKIDKIPALEKLLSQKMSEINAIPSKQSKEYEENENLRFSNFIEIIERDEPIPKPLDIYKDPDSIHKYWHENLIKPMYMAVNMASGEYSLDYGAEGITINDDVKKFMVDKGDDYADET